MDLDTRGEDEAMAQILWLAIAQCYLQIKPTVCLNVCEWMNMTERIAIALTFDLLSCNRSMLVKETSYRKTFININYNNISLPFFCFVKPIKKILLLFR